MTTNDRLDPGCKVSVVMRAKNEEKYIEQTLSGLFSQSHKNLEVIIVDSGSSDRTIEIAEKFPVCIYRIRPEDFSFGYALNIGFQKASGVYVFCLSAHALPASKGCLTTALVNFSDDRVAAVMTRTLPWSDCNPFDRRGLMRKFNKPRMDISRGPLFLFSNANSIIRRDVWERVPFNEDLTGSEDLDWQLKVAKLDYKIIYEPEAAVFHSHNESLKQIYKRSYREEYAVRELNVRQYSLWRSIFDFFVGSVYDMIYVLVKIDNVKWFFFAPMRRFVMNVAKFRASNYR